MTAEALPVLGPPRCTGGCNRIVVARTLWVKYTHDQRRQLHRTHARYQSEGMCCTCYRHHHPTPVREPDYRGLEWPAEAWRRGRNGIMYPVGPRPVDADSPNYRRRDPELLDLFDSFTTHGEC